MQLHRLCAGSSRAADAAPSADTPTAGLRAAALRRLSSERTAIPESALPISAELSVCLRRTGSASAAKAKQQVDTCHNHTLCRSNSCTDGDFSGDIRAVAFALQGEIKADEHKQQGKQYLQGGKFLLGRPRFGRCRYKGRLYHKL